jgi:hypothetical protein
MVKLEHIKTGRVFEFPDKNALDLLVNFPDDYRVKKGIEKIEYLKKFLADVEKLKNEKILITAKVKTGEVEIKPQKAVEVYCIDSQGNKRTLEEIYSQIRAKV